MARIVGIEYEPRSQGAAIPFESIDEPGCYIVNATGYLIRVPEDVHAADLDLPVNF